jgi:hypothetical protein
MPPSPLRRDWSPKFIIGNDMSLTDSGIVVLDRDGKRVDSFHITTASSPIDYTRIDKIVDDYFTELNKYILQDDCLFAFEEIRFSGKTSAKAGARFQLLGVLQWLLRQEHSVRVIGITNQVWVSMFVYPSKSPRASDARKKAVNQICRQRHGFVTGNMNVSDAYGIAHCAVQHAVRGKNLTNHALSPR